MKPALEKFLIIAATLAAIGIFIYAALWTSISGKKTQMDNLFDNTNVPTSFHFVNPTSSDASGSYLSHVDTSALTAAQRMEPLSEHTILG